VSEVMRTKDFNRTKIVDIVKCTERNGVLYLRIPHEIVKALNLTTKHRFAVYFDGRFIIYEMVPYGGLSHEEG